MPFTPFHMGPGLAFKALLGRRLSLLTFGISQVAIDVEPLVRILRGDPILHGFTHTFVGATVIAAGSALIGRPLGQFVLDRWRPMPDERFLAWLRGPERLSWSAAIAGAAIGTYSHVFLDSIMHPDMHPFAPFRDANPWLAWISLADLHSACVLSGIAGLIALPTFYWIATALSPRPRA